jgi:hypothetical protein
MKLEAKHIILSFLIFIISIAVCVSTLLLERKYLNILYDYHPDALHYINNSLTYSKISTEFTYLNHINLIFLHLKSGSGYYYVVALLKANIRDLIKLNIIIYSLTNLLLYYLFFIKNNNTNSSIHNNFFKYIFFIFILFLPYRLHLSTHVLKETFLIFFIILILINNNIFFFLGILGGFFLRNYFFIYLLIFINLKKINSESKISIFFTILLTIIIFIFFINYFTEIKDYILLRNDADMGGRSFDQVPNFKEFGFSGSLLKSIAWPALLLSGGFAIFSKSYLMIGLSFEIIIMQLIFYKIKNRIMFSFGLFLCLSIIAIYCSTYTSFYRYSYLALTFYFIKNLINTNDKKNWFNWY